MTFFCWKGEPVEIKKAKEGIITVGKRENSLVIDSIFFLSSPSLLCSSSCSVEEKTRMLTLVKDLIRNNIIMKEEKGNKIINELLYIEEKIE